MHIAEVVTIAKSLPLLRLNTYKSLILSYSADYRRIFGNKIARFMEETKTRKSIQLTFISSYGLQRNMYSGIAQNEVVLDDLF